MPRKSTLPLPATPETPVKATDAEILRRVATVHKLLVAGASRGSIVQYGSNQWQVTDRQVDDYIARAKQTLLEQTDRDKDRNLVMAIERMQEIYQQCMTAKNYKTAITAQTEINKLLGLYAPVNANVNLTGSVAIKGYIGISPDAWDANDDPSA